MSDWKFELLLGEGTYGVVHRMSNATERRRVARKYFFNEKMFAEELKAAELVKSDHCMQVVGRGREIAQRRIMLHFEELKIPLFYFDMPVMSCGSLAEAIHHKQQQVQRDLPYVYSTESAFNWAVATLHALFYLHEKLHLAHCDLKPENILLARDGSSKLADFSLARDLDIPDRLDYNREKFVGTYKYHAPEIFNNGLITNKIDIFALGVTMFELAEGVCPIDVLQPGAEEKVAVPFLRNGDIPNMTN